MSRRLELSSHAAVGSQEPFALVVNLVATDSLAGRAQPLTRRSALVWSASTRLAHVRTRETVPPS